VLSESNKTSYVPLQVGEGTIHIEVVELGGEEQVAFHAISLTDFTKSVGRVASSVTDTLVDGLKAIKPDRVTVEFGCEVAMESGKLTAILAKGTAKANLKVVVEWSQEPTLHVNSPAERTSSRPSTTRRRRVAGVRSADGRTAARLGSSDN
jgi:hypothetical protein